MIRRTMDKIDVKLGLQKIRQRIEQACLEQDPELQCIKPLLVAVSKTKPIEMIIDAYDADQRHFGENYVKEIVEKGHDEKIIEYCTDIKWHFIGHLQTNKINKLLSVPGLYMIETVDSEKLAVAIDKAWSKINNDNKLKIMLQVNTSQEEEKNGMNPSELNTVAKNVIEHCKHLEFSGLMTIGKFGYDLSQGPNPDFICLKQCRDNLCKYLNLDWKQVHLSMGMSDDFEHAIQMGSTIVRVGSSIFGYRPKKTH